MFAIYSLERSASGVNALAKSDCSVILFKVSINYVMSWNIYFTYHFIFIYFEYLINKIIKNKKILNYHYHLTHLSPTADFLYNTFSLAFLSIYWIFLAAYYSAFLSRFYFWMLPWGDLYWLTKPVCLGFCSWIYDYGVLLCWE